MRLFRPERQVQQEVPEDKLVDSSNFDTAVANRGKRAEERFELLKQRHAMSSLTKETNEARGQAIDQSEQGRESIRAQRERLISMIRNESIAEGYNPYETEHETNRRKQNIARDRMAQQQQKVRDSAIAFEEHSAKLQDEAKGFAKVMKKYLQDRDTDLRENRESIIARHQEAEKQRRLDAGLARYQAEERKKEHLAQEEDQQRLLEAQKEIDKAEEQADHAAQITQLKDRYTTETKERLRNRSRDVRPEDQAESKAHELEMAALRLENYAEQLRELKMSPEEQEKILEFMEKFFKEAPQNRLRDEKRHVETRKEVIRSRAARIEARNIGKVVEEDEELEEQAPATKIQKTTIGRRGPKINRTSPNPTPRKPLDASGTEDWDIVPE